MALHDPAEAQPLRRAIGTVSRCPFGTLNTISGWFARAGGVAWSEALARRLPWQRQAAIGDRRGQHERRCHRRRRWLVNPMSSTRTSGPIGGVRETGSASWMANVALQRRVDGVDQGIAPVVATVTSP